MYNTTLSGLASEVYTFMDSSVNNTSFQESFNPLYNDMRVSGLTKYLLRPETVERLYVMYVKTKNPIFREWGWKIWTTIKEKCKAPYGFADYSGVNQVHGRIDDRAETWFYSETMKYLYLLFSESGESYLDNYVFNTEAHPIPRQTK